MANEDPNLEELLARALVVSLPLRTTFRGLTRRETVIFDGSDGTGEWAAFGEYGDEEASWWLAAAFEQMSHPLTSSELTPVAINAIVPAMPIAEIEGWLSPFRGCTAAKIKVAEKGESLNDDLARVRKVRRVLGSDIAIRLDANGAWTPQEAKDAADAFEQFGIDYLEQPVSTLEEMLELRNLLGASPIRLAADETVRKSHQLGRVREAGCEVVIVKPSPLGGFTHTMALAREAHENGLQVVLSSGLESSVGLTHAASVASAVDRLTGSLTAHGLGTAALHSHDVVKNPLVPQEGYVHPRKLELDRNALATLGVSAEREEWWRARIERCYPLALEKLP
jgi:O-succinylbenzoate synthase